MAKYCKTYNIICTCVTCENVECAYSPRTRAEAEIARGVKLDKYGNEIGAEKDDTARIPAPVFEEPEGKGERRRLTRREVALLSATGLLAILLIAASVIMLRPEQEAQGVALVRETGPETETEEAPEPVEAPGDLIGEETTGPEEELAEGLEMATPEPTPTAEPEPTPAAEVAQAQEPIIFRRPQPTPNPGQVRIERETIQLKDRGNQLVESGEIVAARDAYRQAIQMNPGFYQGYNNLANTYTDQGNYQQAVPLYREGLRQAPDSTTIMFNLANMSFRQGYWWQALQEIERVIERDDSDSEAHLMAGICSFQLGNYERAKSHFTRVIQLDPESAEGHYNLSLAYQRMGSPGVAQSYYAEAVRLEPRITEPSFLRRNRVGRGG